MRVKSSLSRSSCLFVCFPRICAHGMNFIFEISVFHLRKTSSRHDSMSRQTWTTAFRAPQIQRADPLLRRKAMDIWGIGDNIWSEMKPLAKNRNN